MKIVLKYFQLYYFALWQHLFTSKIYVGHDSLFHYQRIEELAIGLRNGVITPTLQSGALGGQGYANSLFYPDIFLLIPALFVILGLDRFDALSLFMFILNIVTFIISYFSLEYFLKDNEELRINKYVPLLGAAAYVAYPYRLYNAIIRCAVSELIAMTFIPIIILACYKLFIKKEYTYWKLLSLGFSLILLSHLSSTLIMGMALIVFLFFNLKVLKDKDFYKAMLKAIGLALLLTGYFLFPMIEQMLSGDYLYSLLPTLSDPILNPNKTIDAWSVKIIPFEANQYVLIIVNVLCIYIFTKIIEHLSSKEGNKKRYIYLTGALLVGVYILIITTNLFPWKLTREMLPIIQQVQFTFRFYMLAGIPFVFILCIKGVRENETILSISSKIGVLAMAAFTLINICIFNIDNWHERDFIINHHLVKNKYTLGFGEFIPSSIENVKYQKKLKKEVDDEDTITTKIYNDEVLDKVYSKKEFNELNIDLSNIKIKDDVKKYNISTELIYYKGYKAFIDGIEVKISTDKQGRIILLDVPSSSKSVVIKYVKTPTQIISIIVSILTLVILIIKTLTANTKNKKFTSDDTEKLFYLNTKKNLN